MSTATKRTVKIVMKVKTPITPKQAKDIEKALTTAPVKLELSSYSIEELMTWRNAARVRADARAKRLLEIKKIQAAMEIETRQLDKKQHSDLIWIGRLQRTLSAKVLG